MGTEVASALLKFSAPLIASPMLASPVSATRRSAWSACTPATACCSAATALPGSVTLPGTWKVTRAVRPSFDTSALPPGCSGVRMSPA